MRLRNKRKKERRKRQTDTDLESGEQSHERHSVHEHIVRAAADHDAKANGGTVNTDRLI